MKNHTTAHITTVLSVLIALGGCSVDPPKPHQFQNTRSYPNVSFDQGWENVVGFFSENSIPIKNIAKDSGVIYAETVRFSPRMADCGGDWADWEDWEPEEKILITAPGKFNVFFRRGDPMTVTVNTDFEIGYHDEGTMLCYSTGVLENLILDAVGGNSAPREVDAGK